MATEIERKFLVHQEYLPELKYGELLIQGYLSVDPQIRFRFQGKILVIAIKKLQKDGSRFELETTKSEVSPEEKEELIRMALFPVIEKIRYRIPFAGLTWEVDVYQGANAGLITADVELPSFDYPIQFPRWIDSEHDITADPRYFNTNLGKRPYTEW